MSKKYFMIAILVLILSIGIASAQDNMTLEESDTPLSDAGHISISDIQEKIDNAKEEDTIEVNGTYCGGYDYEILEINKSLTLAGKDNATFYSNSHLTFNVSQGNVVIKDITFNSHYLTDALFKNKANLTFINCSFNTVDFIDNVGTLSMIGCRLNDTDIENTGSAALTGCELENTRETIKKYGDFRIDNCRFNNIYNMESLNGSFEICNSKFIGNDGFHLIKGEYCLIFNSTFTNTTLYIESEKSRISKSSFNLSDVNIDNGTTEINESEFHHTQLGIDKKQNAMKMNFIKGEHLIIELECDSFELSDSNVKKLWLSIENNGMTVKDCNFTDAFIHSNSENNLIENTTIETGELWVYAGEINNCNITNLKNFNANGDFKMKNTQFTNMEGLTQNMGDLIIDGCTFKNSINERALLMASNLKSKLTVRNSSFINNTCKWLFDLSYSEDITFENNLFLNNTCSRTLLWEIYIYYESGEKPNVYLNILNNVFMNNWDNSGEYSQIFIYPSLMDFTGKLNPFHIRIEDNFLGFNMANKRELYTMPVFDISATVSNLYDTMTWSNVDIAKSGDEYTLRALNNKNKEVNLPATLFGIKDKKTGETLNSNLTIAEKFKMNRTSEEVYILNEANEIVNKPKANMTCTIVGDSYEDILITVHVEYDSKPVKNEIICLEVTETNEYGSSTMIRTYPTDDNGDMVLFKYDTHNPPTYGQDFDNADSHYDFILTHSSRKFGISEISYTNFKIKSAECIVSGKDITTNYNTRPQLKLNVKTKNGKTVASTQIEIFIYKNGKLIFDGYGFVDNGKVTYKLPRLGAGKYQIKITDTGWTHSIKKTINMNVNKLKLKVKAPKVKNKYKKSQYFKFTIKNAKNIKVKLKIGKKTYTVKTDKKGKGKFNTKKLKRGTYKVTITPKSSNYLFKAKSKITIKR